MRIGKTEKPEFTRKLNNRDIKEGRPVKFECSAKGIPVPEISWFLNDKPVEGVRFHTDVRKSFSDVIHSLSIDKTEVEDAGEVKARAKNKAGEAVTIAKLLVEGNQVINIQRNLSKPNLLGTKFCVQNTPVYIG